eukprot:Skav220160  [mRNA]  locus=scaffold564:217155:221322:- [translate_table: standard]
MQLVLSCIPVLALQGVVHRAVSPVSSPRATHRAVSPITRPRRSVVDRAVSPVSSPRQVRNAVVQTTSVSSQGWGRSWSCLERVLSDRDEPLDAPLPGAVPHTALDPVPVVETGYEAPLQRGDEGAWMAPLWLATVSSPKRQAARGGGGGGGGATTVMAVVILVWHQALMKRQVVCRRVRNFGPSTGA